MRFPASGNLNMLWACITFPRLALDMALRSVPDPAAPLALVDGPASCRSLVAVNGPAARLGLRVGQKLVVARAIHGDFTALPYEAEAVQRCQQWLAGWAYHYSDQVCSVWPQAIVLEVGSSLRLMGGWQALLARLRDELAALQFQYRMAVAPFARTAHVLAWLRDGLVLRDPARVAEVLARVPVRRAGLSAHAGERLYRLGIRHLGQVFALPRDGLRRRFGVQLLQDLDELRGERQPPLPLFRVPPHVDMCLSLDDGVTDCQRLMFPVRRLVVDLAAYLGQRMLGVQQVLLILQHDHCRAGTPETCLVLRLLAPVRDGATLFMLLKIRLESTRLPRPVVAVRLVVSDLQRLAPVEEELFRQTAPSESWEVLCERLRVRLGEEAVYRLEGVADPRPERAWQKRIDASLSAGAVMSAAGQPAAGDGRLLRPGWLLPQPRPLARPVSAIVRGPERLESGWWDGDDLRRDYYVLRLANGQLAWAFSAIGQHGPWTLHGWFA